MRTTLSGKPPDPDYDGPAPQPIDSSGMHKDYWILSEDERGKGFIRPVRQTYIHDKCQTTTTMNLAIAETYARDPKFYNKTFCVFCKEHFNVQEFKWNHTDELVGS